MERRPSEAAAPPLMRIAAADHPRARLFNFHGCETFGGTTFQWSKPVAMVRLALPPHDYFVRLNTAAIRGCTSRLPIELYWNDEPIPWTAIYAERGEITFRVPRGQCADGVEQRLLLMTEPLPIAAPETRLLGVPLVELEIWQEESSALKAGRRWKGIRTRHRIASLWRRPTPFPDWALDGLRSLTIASPAVATTPVTTPVSANAMVATPTIATPEVGLPPVAAVSDPVIESRPRPVICDSAIVCPTEINSRHGTGVLLQYMFPQLEHIAVLESIRCYERERVPAAVTWELPAGLPRPEIYRCVLDWFQHAPPRRAFVVPYLRSDLQMAMALKDLFGTRLVLHVMDDNTLVGQEIPSELMEEAICKSEVRFAISPEMRTAYEQRYGQKFYLLPPVVRADLIDVPREIGAATIDRGAVIGNLWSPEWVERLAQTVRDSGLQVDWFCNNPKVPWVAANKESLARDGVFVRDPLWGDDLVKELRRRPFLLLPTGDPADKSAKAIAKLSLPSRAVFHTAAVQTPILVLGSAETAVAGFVNQFQLGEVVPYNSELLRDAAARLSQPSETARVRAVCQELSPRFSASDIETWIWQSMDRGRPADDRFESLYPAKATIADYVAPAAPRDIYWAQHPVWQMLSRYHRYGGRPKTILDVGASNGGWSYLANFVFPQSHFVLCEPLFGRYPQTEREWYVAKLSSHELIEKVVTNHSGSTKLVVSDTLFGSSLLAVGDVHGSTRELPAECITLDALDQERDWLGPVLLKADVQLAEHLVIAGATKLLRSKVDAVFLELSLDRGHAQAKTYAEMVELMAALDFVVFDETEGWRDPRTGQLEQKDVLFVKRKATFVS